MLVNPVGFASRSILSTVYLTSECLSTYSKPSWLNDYDRGDSPGPQTSQHARRRRSMGRPACLKGLLQCSTSHGVTLCLSVWLQPHLHTPRLLLSPERPWVYCSEIWVDSSLMLFISTQALGQKGHSLSVISLMSFSITKLQLSRSQLRATAGHGPQQCDSGVHVQLYVPAP